MLLVSCSNIGAVSNTDQNVSVHNGGNGVKGNDKCNIYVRISVKTLWKLGHNINLR